MPLLVEVVYATLTKGGKVRKRITGIAAGADGPLGKAVLKLTDEAFDAAKIEAKMQLKEKVIGLQSIELLMSNMANIRRECGGKPSELFGDATFDEAGHDQTLAVDHQWLKNKAGRRQEPRASTSVPAKSTKRSEQPVQRRSNHRALTEGRKRRNRARVDAGTG